MPAPAFLDPTGLDAADWRARFRWSLPTRLNLADQICTAIARRTPDRIALRILHLGSKPADWSYGALDAASNRLANIFLAHGIGRGDRVAMLLPQGAEVVIAHLATYKIGAIAVPLANLFGPDAIGYRISHAGVVGLVTHTEGLARLAASGAADGLLLAVTVDGGPAECWGDLLAKASDAPVMADTGPHDPALMIYTSGTTGQPKGALHGHRVLTGHLPGFLHTHRDFGAPRDRFWTPSDWAWAGGLLNALFPALAGGVPVVGGDLGRFDPERALVLLADEEIRNLFLPPTALRMLRDTPSRAFKGIRVRTLVSAGETLDAATRRWSEAAFGIPVNEVYGQTEANYVAASSGTDAREGMIGRVVPGHTVAILGEDGRKVSAGETGEIAIRSNDPVMFLGYWRDEAATRAAFAGGDPHADWSDAGRVDGAWLRTGDLGIMDADGFVGFRGRADDVITTAGYRVGPAEIEACLLDHPAVALVAVVGVPDALRTERIRAVIVPTRGTIVDEALVAAIQAHARRRLSSHQYPREIVFADALPLTTSGKVIRRRLRDEALAAVSRASGDTT